MSKMKKCSHLNKIAFLDRDGVINAKMPEGCYVRNWREFEFLDGAISGIQLLNNWGYKVIVVTNQRGIAKKLMTEEDVKIIHQKMLNDIKKANGKIEAVYYCPHDIGECDCRKPGIGMFLKVEEVYAVDKENSFMIGDSLSDIEAGQKYGIRSYLLRAPENLKSCVTKILEMINEVP